MKILLRLTLDCEPDVAWKAIADPQVFAAVSAPLLTFKSLEKSGFPHAWDGSGPHLVSLKVFGLIPLGTQTIDVSFTKRPGGVRMMVDSGSPQSGPLNLVRSWDHRMAISASGKQTLYRDRLIFSAGIWTPMVFLSLWSFWQWRAGKLKKLAKKWS